MKLRTQMTYAKAGVSIAAGEELVRRIGPMSRRTQSKAVLAGVGGFSALFQLGGADRRRYRHPVLVSSTDGVGTKIKIAVMMHVHGTIGIDLVAMSVNDILTQGAEPLFFLDYFVCGRLDVAVAESVIRGIAAGCRQAECALIGGETAEHPGDFPPGEYDLAGFAVGVLEKEKILNPQSISRGDFLVGLLSTGLHSNGFSLARKVLFDVAKLKLGAHVPELGRTLGAELLEPTRIYTAAVRALWSSGAVKGIAHITGGGIPGNLPRVLPPGRRASVDRRSWKVPPIFDLIRRLGRVSANEMDRTFNNGIGMILVIDKNEIDRVAAILRKLGERHRIIGEIKKGARGVSFVT